MQAYRPLTYEKVNIPLWQVRGVRRGRILCKITEGATITADKYFVMQMFSVSEAKRTATLTAAGVRGALPDRSGDRG